MTTNQVQAILRELADFKADVKADLVRLYERIEPITVQDSRIRKLEIDNAKMKGALALLAILFPLSIGVVLKATGN